MSENRWWHDHPLFRSGVFLLPAVTSHGGFQIQGYYNPVVDSITLLGTSDEIWQHETAHRVSSAFAFNVTALRMLAGISHSLLFAIVDIVDREGVQLVGKALETLRVAHHQPGHHLVSSIVERLGFIEELFDMCYWSTVPVAEMAAVDFTPLKASEGMDGWVPPQIEDTKGSRSWKSQQVDAIGTLLANQDVAIYQPPHENIRVRLRSAWDAYISIEDTRARSFLIDLAMSSSLQCDSGKLDSLSVIDSLGTIRRWVPHTQRPEGIEALSKELIKRTQETRRCLGEAMNRALSDLPTSYQEPLKNTLMVENVLLYSISSPDDSRHLLPAPHIDAMTNPEYSLFTFRLESDGRRSIDVNPDLLSLSDFLIAQELVSRAQAPENDWWQRLCAFEAVRQALKNGKPVICPFLGWEGVECNEQCSVRAVMNVLQERTELTTEGAICSL